MQLLLWVVHHGLANDAGGRVCGMAVGESPQVQTLSEREVSSFVEFRCDVEVEDPLTELQIAVARTLAKERAFAPDQILEHEQRRCSIRLRLEPGFDDARAIVEPLAQLLRAFRVRGDRVVSTDGMRASV